MCSKQPKRLKEWLYNAINAIETYEYYSGMDDPKKNLKMIWTRI